ncbi:MAG: hypothetical protein KDM91_16530 [Verrucomicrobiae bacterium]|nr:hypothetical protein [Verrucomicrobiae bacterium]
MAFHRRIERFFPAAAPRALLAALCVGAMGGLFAAREADGQEAQPAPAPAPAGDDDFGVETPKAKPEAAAEAAPASEEKQYLSAIDAHLTFLQALETEKRFPSAATCGECHPDQYREWSVSAHAYAQLSPIFNTMHAAIVERTAGTNGDFCIRCHTQVGMQRDEPLFTSNLKRHPASVEGITCIVCHRIEENYGKVSGRMHINQGAIFEPVFGPQGNKILKETLQREDLAKKLNPAPPVEGEEERVGKKDIHGDVVKFDPISTSGFCGTCHDVNLYNGFRLEEAFTQFKNSPAAAKGETCQDCHMGKIPGAVVPGVSKKDDPERFALLNYLRGPGARIGGDVGAKADDPATGQYGVATPERKRTSHLFAGPDYSIVHPALFPHSEDLRQAMWEYEREIPGAGGKFERVGMKHLIAFKWEDGWGDPESGFEKKAVETPDLEKGLPWPWNDSVARLTLREKLNDSFKLLNEIDRQRHQMLRRALQFGDFKVTRNDAGGLAFALQIVNATDGHGAPTGFDAERLMFLHTTVTDRRGRVVYESGDRDPNGDVRDLHSAFVHHRAEKSGPWLEASAWKEAAGLARSKDDRVWLPDPDLFSLQSRFLTRNNRGGEREQILAINYSVDPLPYIRPDTRPGILVARPAAARKQFRGLPPLGSIWAEYRVDPARLTGEGPYTVRFRFVCQMVPVNLVREIADRGFDYNLSPREVGKRVAYGHRVTASDRDEDRRGGALTIWDRTLTLGDAPQGKSLKPTEAEIMAAPEKAPFPWKDPAIFGAIGGISVAPPVELPTHPDGSLKPSPILPKPSKGNTDDRFE